MKANTPSSEISVQGDERTLANSGQASGRNGQNFARQLRALGQALEKFTFSAFDLEMRNGVFLVTAKSTWAEQRDVSFPRFVGECLGRLSFWPMLSSTDHQVDLRFSPEDIEQFDLRRKNQRRDASKMPNPYSISQLLRGAGCYLDNQKIAERVRISLEGRWVMVGYRTDEGCLMQAQRNVEYFYDYWVKMYLRRGTCVKLTAPSEPTVLVTLRGIQNV